MPTATETRVTGLASCRNGRCPGYKQQPAELIQTETEYSYFDLGGDVPGIERSTVMFRFADPDEERCQHCGEPRLCDVQVRPIYANVSGVPQDALLRVGEDSERVRDLELANAQRAAEAAQMQALMERQAAALDRQERQIAELTADLASRPRGPGRPRKVPDE
jgi:hypothetical protein